VIDRDGDAIPPAVPLRVLFLAFEFAPLTAGGVYRALGFARTLPACGIELDVVTVQEEDYAAWTSAPLDRSLLTDLPEGVHLHRIPSGFPSWYWALTRGRAGFRFAQYAHWGDPVSTFWRRPLLALLDRLVPARHPDVLLATAPPFGVAVLARAVARRYRLPWVVDLRDAWTRWSIAPYPTVGHYLYARTRETAVLEHANVTVATSHVTRAEWMTDRPATAPERLVTIYNGFDDAHDDAHDDEHDGAHDGARDGDEQSNGEGEGTAVAVPAGLRHIVYVGSFYYTPEAHAATFRPLWRRRPHQWLHYRLRRENWLYRSPYFFLRGLRHLADQMPDLAARLHVTFVGRVPAWLPAMLAETRTTGAVALPGVLPHARVLRLEREADAVLLTGARIDKGRDYSIAGKVFEYFAARTPILALLPDGAMRDLVTESGLGLFADPDDVDAIAALLARLATTPEPRRLVSANESFIARFDRRVLAEQMADCLRRAAREGYRG
jgi:glycosyltransferase involved in cell wall biosynthesis